MQKWFNSRFHLESLVVKYLMQKIKHSKLWVPVIYSITSLFCLCGHLCSSPLFWRRFLLVHAVWEGLRRPKGFHGEQVRNSPFRWIESSTNLTSPKARGCFFVLVFLLFWPWLRWGRTHSGVWPPALFATGRLANVAETPGRRFMIRLEPSTTADTSAAARRPAAAPATRPRREAMNSKTCRLSWRWSDLPI